MIYNGKFKKNLNLDFTSGEYAAFIQSEKVKSISFQYQFSRKKKYFLYKCSKGNLSIFVLFNKQPLFEKEEDMEKGLFYFSHSFLVKSRMYLSFECLSVSLLR